MAVDATSTSGSNFERTTGLIAGDPFTMLCWLSVSSMPTTGMWCWSREKFGPDELQGFFVVNETGVMQFRYNMTGAFVTLLPTPIAVNTWTHVGYVRDGTHHQFYRDGVIEWTEENSGTFTATIEGLMSRFGSNGPDWPLHGAMAYVRQWAGALTQAEVQMERDSTTVIRTADLWADWPLAGMPDGELDISGNGRDWDPIGTLATAPGPTIYDVRAPLRATRLSQRYARS